MNVAKTVVAASELTLKSKEQLFDQKIISSYDLEMARTTLQRDKAQLAQAEANETQARNDATPLTTVSDNSEMYVYFSMTGSMVLSLTRQFGSLDNVLKNMPDLQLQLSDGSTYSEPGRIETISGIIDPSTGAVSVRAFPQSTLSPFRPPSAPCGSNLEAGKSPGRDFSGGCP